MGGKFPSAETGDNKNSENIGRIQYNIVINTKLFISPAGKKCKCIILSVDEIIN